MYGELSVALVVNT